jgi:hypothetical protein
MNDLMFKNPIPCFFSVGWLPRNKYLVSDAVNCTAVLVYTANLVRPGLVTFAYQYEDDNVLFTFEVGIGGVVSSQ